MADVLKILRGSKANYDSLISPDANTIYITSDTGEVFLGSNKLNVYEAGAGITIDEDARTISAKVNGSTVKTDEEGRLTVDLNMSVTKTSTSGLTDTYTMSLADGSASTFEVTNGAKGDKGDTGEQGVKGDKGEKGDRGKSAYEQAQEGGYTGTEAELDATLATAQTQINSKQATLVSGTNIKTINNTSLLGGGNIELSSGWGNITGNIEDQTDLMEMIRDKQIYEISASAITDMITRITQ